MKKRVLSVVFVIMLLLLIGCKEDKVANYDENKPLILDKNHTREEISMQEFQGSVVEEESEPGISVLENSEHESMIEEKEEGESESETTLQEDSTDLVNEAEISGNSKLIVIDAGHQLKGNSDKEPIGPGATETKAKVTGGATGCQTGQKEYELNLAVAIYLKEELSARGYEVIMVRETNDIDISNSERAAVANNAGADAFIRIHANGSDNSQVSGVETLCQTSSNPYNASLYPDSRKLSEKVLEGVVMQTEFKKRRVVETDNMSGINWCSVPVTIIEMGFLSNPEEDNLLNTQEYRKKVATGIADGIDAYFNT